MYPLRAEHSSGLGAQFYLKGKKNAKHQNALGKISFCHRASAWGGEGGSAVARKMRKEVQEWELIVRGLECQAKGFVLDLMGSRDALTNFKPEVCSYSSLRGNTVAAGLDTIKWATAGERIA